MTALEIATVTDNQLERMTLAELKAFRAAAALAYSTVGDHSKFNHPTGNLLKEAEELAKTKILLYNIPY